MKVKKRQTGRFYDQDTGSRCVLGLRRAPSSPGIGMPSYEDKKDKHDLNTHTNTVECAQRLFNVEVLYRCLVVVVFSLFNMKETPR